MDADAALQELGSDLIGEAYVTATVTVWDEDARVADDKLRFVEKVIQGRDFTCIAESANAVEAWPGEPPGHVFPNRAQAAGLHVKPCPHVAAIGVVAGPERNDHLG